MIPHRMPGNETANSVLRDRVTACRKRLRESRMMLRAQTNGRFAELFPEAAASLRNYPSVSVSGPAGLDCCEQLESQEVGIT